VTACRLCSGWFRRPGVFDAAGASSRPRSRPRSRSLAGSGVGSGGLGGIHILPGGAAPAGVGAERFEQLAPVVRVAGDARGAGWRGREFVLDALEHAFHHASDAFHGREAPLIDVAFLSTER